MGTADIKSGRWHSNPNVLTGMPDIHGFTNINDKDVFAIKAALGVLPGFASKPFVIEVKSDTGILSPAQQIYRYWCLASGGMYILAQGETGIEEVRKRLCL